MTTPIPRFLLPKGPLLPRTQQQIPHRSLLKPYRHVTSNVLAKPGAPLPKSPVLGEPDQFRPPSHGRRLKEQIPRNYGPELTKQQKVEQEKKQYPNMFPPKGTWMFWFLTNRDIHVWITMGTLLSLAGYATFENWCRDTRFKSRFPSFQEFFAHPIRSLLHIQQLIKEHTMETTKIARDIRLNKVDDVQKRNSYRKYHGIEDKQGLGPWMPTEERLKAWQEKRAGEDGTEEKPKKPSRAFLGISWGD